MEVPKLMQHLPRDARGYPVPYFAPIIEGEPNFKYSDPNKKRTCRKYSKCWVCGLPLWPRSFWFITGPLGLKSQAATDEAMHEECARYSLAACPHLFYEKAKRTSKAEEATPLLSQLMAKPSIIYLVKADKIVFLDQDHTRYRSKEVFKFVYVDGKLTPEK